MISLSDIETSDDGLDQIPCLQVRRAANSKSHDHLKLSKDYLVLGKEAAQKKVMELQALVRIRALPPRFRLRHLWLTVWPCRHQGYKAPLLSLG